MFDISRKDLYQIVACARVRLEDLISLCDKRNIEFKDTFSEELKIVSQLATALTMRRKINVTD